MASDFSRTLALLRKEKKISQRTAAGDLEVSQALLSHYENGLREPGLGFVVRAAEYYGVSCDYLLGRSMVRDIAAAFPERLHDASAVPGSEETTFMLQRKQITSCVTLLFEVAQQSGSMQLSDEITAYFSLVVYKVFRYLYMADPESVEAAFRTPTSQFDGLCNAQMALHELRIRAAAHGSAHIGSGQYGSVIDTVSDEHGVSKLIAKLLQRFKLFAGEKSCMDRVDTGLFGNRGSRGLIIPGQHGGMDAQPL